ncbi:hypothetical protein [Teichococcus vastitatis]|uniref:hypothetical protein n=1 Tax=Teichococcus vastitatis TaxID=2307076 RepID=UPI001EE422E1|nr:hypothetical protein [Pseudoroseomonas vastitatis]
MLCVANAQMMVGFFVLQHLELPPAEAAQAAGVAPILVGVALLVSQMLVRRLGWLPSRLIRIGGTVSAFGFVAVSLAASVPRSVGRLLRGGLRHGMHRPGLLGHGGQCCQAA